MITKVCSMCGKSKNLDEFGLNRSTPDNLAWICKLCNRIRVMGYTYGLSTDDYINMYNKQEGKCAICGLTESKPGTRLVIDHDHQTKKVRGLLCRKCNTGLGCLGDSIDGLNTAIKYLESIDNNE